MKTLKNAKLGFGNHDIANELNAAYVEGYRFMTQGEYERAGTTDPWSGMPDFTNSTFLFTTKEEAEAFAETQNLPFTSGHPHVFEILPHTETWEEIHEQEKIKAEAKKAKAAATEARKAAKAGMTVEQYRKEKRKQANIRKAKREIERLEAELAETKKWLAELEG